MKSLNSFKLYSEGEANTLSYKKNHLCFHACPSSPTFLNLPYFWPDFLPDDSPFIRTDAMFLFLCCSTLDVSLLSLSRHTGSSSPLSFPAALKKQQKRAFSPAMTPHYVNYFTSFSCNFPDVDKQIAAAANLRHPNEPFR